MEFVAGLERSPQTRMGDSSKILTRDVDGDGDGIVIPNFLNQLVAIPLRPVHRYHP